MFIGCSKLLHQLHYNRSFIAARIRWVRDPYLDTVVSKELNLKQLISLKNQIVFSPSKFLPLSSLSLLKPSINLPTTAHKFFSKYPSIFSQFQPAPSLPLHVKLTPKAFSLHKEEQDIHDLPSHRDDTVKRLAKLLMLARGTRLPLYVIDGFKLDLGLPHDYVTSLLSDYPEYFDVCDIDGCLCLELVSWKDELAVSEMERRVAHGDLRNVQRGERIGFSLSFPKGFDLAKRVKDWVFEWQDLPYISPYEDAFHLDPDGDYAEKWTVAVLHELMCLLISKKTEKQNLLQFGDYLGFGERFKKALVHHTGIFYVSNKIRTQTVVLREAYRKNFLVQNHPLMGMRFRYIFLMNQGKETQGKAYGDALRSQLRKPFKLHATTSQETNLKARSRQREEKEFRSSLVSEYDDV
ncbi:hypothetical protein K2173_020852 [Erythroxylum novogranatense]|uniref:PORR domain-containing protein n=1 Tax=Erythroxylum novogranatense TaxID=1862640 RepID=A0AAV8TM38_9ROSI|nr:hypothetical protein K2173_020852 [Erythroxylum novogranatense]